MRAALIRLGFEPGRVVWVQSSWNEFYNFDGKPSTLVALMRELLGPKGTLVMPAFPLGQDPTKILKIDTIPSSTGLLTEVFRRSANVKRSIQLTSSVCASGPAADYLVADHHRDPFPWGRRTPYWRLYEMDARMIGLGIASTVSYFTPLHVVECILYDEVPLFQRVFDGKVTYRWQRRSGEEGEQEFMRRVGRLSPRRYSRYFPKKTYTNFKISNLDMVGADARNVLDRALELARSGITLYNKRSVRGR
jgi:aminoglycoside 3-N-acetyltransferase